MSLAATRGEYRVRMKSLEKKVDWEILRKVALLQERRRSEQEVRVVEFESSY